jgi:hypothetical protein
LPGGHGGRKHNNSLGPQQKENALLEKLTNQGPSSGGEVVTLEIIRNEIVKAITEWQRKEG